MFKKLVPLVYKTHQDFKLSPVEDFGFAGGFHVAALTVHEFMRAASIYPIVFLADGDSYRPVVLLGLKEQQNLFVTSEGAWQASYIPASIRRYPFSLMSNDTEGEFTICLDEQSQVFAGDSGEALFDADGEFSESFTKVTEMLRELQASDLLTTDFCERLQKHDLFAPLKIGYQIDQDKHELDGCFVINEQAWNKLDEEAFEEFKKRGYLPAVYAQSISFGQVERLVELQRQLELTTNEPQPAIH